MREKHFNKSVILPCIKEYQITSNSQLCVFDQRGCNIDIYCAWDCQPGILLISPHVWRDLGLRVFNSYQKFQSVGKGDTPSWFVLLVLGFK
jgi:hypothetical protein